MADEFDVAPLGHNSGAISLPERLQEDYAGRVQEVDQLLNEAREMPKELQDDDDDAKFSKLIARATALNKALDASRVDEKAPFLKAGREIDGFFGLQIERCKKTSTVLNNRLTAYKLAKDRRERAERERLAREEAQRAEAARQEALRLEAEAVKASEEQRHAEADQHLDAAIDASATARAAEIDAQVAQRAAEAKPSELARTRHDGGLSTVVTYWDCEVVDRNVIDLEVLRPFLSDDAIEKALRAAMRAGRRDIKGAKIFEAHRSSVR